MILFVMFYYFEIDRQYKTRIKHLLNNIKSAGEL